MSSSDIYFDLSCFCFILMAWISVVPLNMGIGVVNKSSWILRKTREVAFLLVLLLFAVQFTCGVCSIDSAANDIEKSPIHNFQQGNHVIEAVLSESNDRGNSFAFSDLSFPVAFPAYIYFVHFHESNSSYHRELPDYRKEIKRTNPHFFHGSNYKEYSLFI